MLKYRNTPKTTFYLCSFHVFEVLWHTCCFILSLQRHWDFKGEFCSSRIWEEDAEIQEAWVILRTSVHGKRPFTLGGIPALENQHEEEDAFNSWPITDVHCDHHSKHNLE